MGFTPENIQIRAVITGKQRQGGGWVKSMGTHTNIHIMHHNPYMKLHVFAMLCQGISYEGRNIQ